MTTNLASSARGALTARGWGSPVDAVSAVATSGRPARMYVTIAFPTTVFLVAGVGLGSRKAEVPSTQVKVVCRIQ